MSRCVPTSVHESRNLNDGFFLTNSSIDDIMRDSAITNTAPLSAATPPRIPSILSAREANLCSPQHVHPISGVSSSSHSSSGKWLGATSGSGGDEHSTQGTTRSSERSPLSSPRTFAPTNICVRNIPQRFNEDQLEEVFSVFGRIVSSAIMRNIHTGESLGMGFIRYATFEEARRCMNAAGQWRSGSAPIPALLRPPFGGATPPVLQWANKQNDCAPTEAERHRYRKIFIRNIPREVTLEALTELFGRYGPVKDTSLHRDTMAAKNVPARSLDKYVEKRIAFVTYHVEGAAERAAKEIHNTQPFPQCRGVPVMVKLAEDTPTARNQGHPLTGPAAMGISPPVLSQSKSTLIPQGTPPVAVGVPSQVYITGFCAATPRGIRCTDPTFTTRLSPANIPQQPSAGSTPLHGKSLPTSMGAFYSMPTSRDGMSLYRGSGTLHQPQHSSLPQPLPPQLQPQPSYRAASTPAGQRVPTIARPPGSSYHVVLSSQSAPSTCVPTVTAATAATTNGASLRSGLGTYTDSIANHFQLPSESSALQPPQQSLPTPAMSGAYFLTSPGGGDSPLLYTIPSSDTKQQQQQSFSSGMLPSNMHHGCYVLLPQTALPGYTLRPVGPTPTNQNGNIDPPVPPTSSRLCNGGASQLPSTLLTPISSPSLRLHADGESPTIATTTAERTALLNTAAVSNSNRGLYLPHSAFAAGDVLATADMRGTAALSLVDASFLSEHGSERPDLTPSPGTAACLSMTPSGHPTSFIGLRTAEGAPIVEDPPYCFRFGSGDDEDGSTSDGDGYSLHNLVRILGSVNRLVED